MWLRQERPGMAEVVVIPAAGHFEVVAPTSTAWPVVRDRALDLLNARIR
jgi:hypothetical protein